VKLIARFASGAESLSSRWQEYLDGIPTGEMGLTATEPSFGASAI
jgi:hypothetical protein